MKNLLKFIVSLLAWLAIASLLAGMAGAYGVHPLVTFAGLFVITLLMAAYGGKCYADGAFRNETVNVVEWQRIIVKHLFKENAHLKMCVRADEYVVKNSAVVIPQAGALPQVIKNNNTFPLVAVQRTDSVIMYPLSSYVTTPTFITLDELENISYDKTESVYDDHFKILVQTCADDQIINWANGLPGATNVVYTTGAPTASLEIGQGGQRNTCVFGDVKKLQRLMNKNNVDPMGRVLLMEANMYDQFTDSLSATQYKDFSATYDPKTGTMGKLFGFDIMTRSSVIAAAIGLDGSGNLALNALGAAIGATDNIGCLAWQKNSLELAMGMVHLFNRINDPLYTGDINNCRIKAGGRVRRVEREMWRSLR